MQPPQPPPPPFIGQEGPGPADGLAIFEENTDNFLSNLVEPQWGQRVPFQREERTRISLSLLQSLQRNS